jgi:hypothetical protein
MCWPNALGAASPGDRVPRVRSSRWLLARLRAKLVETEAAIQALAPELPLTARRHTPNPIFARGEMNRMALDVLRRAGEPLPIRVIAVRMLAAKGIALPDPATRRHLRKRLRIGFTAMDRRGVTVRVGDGCEARRTLAKRARKRRDSILRVEICRATLPTVTGRSPVTGLHVITLP